MTRARALSCAIVAAAALGLGACDWRVFDELADETWVDSSRRPDGMSSAEYGLRLAAVQGASGQATVVVAARIPDGLARVTYDGDGNRQLAHSPLSGTPGPMLEQPVLAGDPGASVVAVAVTSTGPHLLLYDTSDFSPVASIPLDPGPGTIDTMAFGVTSAGGARDLVLTRGNELLVVGDYASSGRTIASCVLPREAGFSLAVADMDPSTPGDEIVVAIGNASRSGSSSEVLVLPGGLVADAAAVGAGTPCLDAGTRDPLVTLAAPDGEADFGAQLAIADFDGDGDLDVAASAPATTRVLVYGLDLTAGSASAPVVITAPAGSVSFGETLAAGDLNGDGDPELIVGDPRAEVDGVASAGVVHLYRQAASASPPRLVLHDASPESFQRFGRSLATVPMGGALLLAVAADGEVFTYFRTALPGHMDPRR